MPQISATIGKSTYDTIKNLEEKEGISSSKICATLIEKGLAYTHEQEKFLLLKKNQIEQQRYLYRLLNICSEMFLNSNKDKNHYKCEPEEILNSFKMKARRNIQDD